MGQEGHESPSLPCKAHAASSRELERSMDSNNDNSYIIYYSALGKKFTANCREVSPRGVIVPFARQKGGRCEMGLPTPPASPVTVTLLSQLLNYDCAHISLNRSTLTYSQLCCCFCKVLPQHQITLTISLLACCHIHTPKTFLMAFGLMLFNNHSCSPKPRNS